MSPECDIPAHTKRIAALQAEVERRGRLIAEADGVKTRDRSGDVQPWNRCPWCGSMTGHHYAPCRAFHPDGTVRWGEPNE